MIRRLGRPPEPAKILFGKEKYVFPYQDAKPGPSSPQPSRYAITDPFSTSITSSKHINKVAQSNMGIAGVPYRERCKAGLAVRHPELAH